DEALTKKLNSAVFPGLQGGPLMHVIAAKAVAFAEALRPDFKVYAKNVVENAKALAESLRANGLDIVSGGTDNHLMLVDLRPKGLKGNVSEKALVRAAITCNKNGIPFDPETPFVTSGLRLGTPAATTRGFGVAEFQQVGGLIAEVLNAIAQSSDGKAPLVEAAIKERVKKMVSTIVRELETGGEAEISSEVIGETVMEHLRTLDDVAYVRFASVYRNFREAKDFADVLGELSGEEEARLAAIRK